MSTAFSIGGFPWPGLSKIVEEIGELLQVAGKLIATGGSIAHWDGTDLRARLLEELADVLAACQFFIEANELDADALRARTAVKLARFRRWHELGGAYMPDKP